MLGCLRMYNPEGDSFEWGSWLIVEEASPLVALESAICMYSYARRLGFLTAKINVRKENISVWKFHENVFGAVLLEETGLDLFYEVSAEAIDMRLKKYKSLLLHKDNEL